MAVEQVMEKWLSEGYDYTPPKRGEIREGVVLKVMDVGAAIDVGLKRDGFVPYGDLMRLDDETVARLKPGQEVTTRVVKPRDKDDNLILSLYEARLEEDWKKAAALIDADELVTVEATGYNKGGLLVRFEHLEGFVPASHLEQLRRRQLPPAEREAKLQDYVGQELTMQLIEVDRNQRRLIFSERLARQKMKEQHIDRLLKELIEGDVTHGIVSRLTDFGAFVDLGGADGLIHVSELAWHRVKHPREVLQVGDEVQVYILRLDHERKRISLSLKRLQPDPWTLVQETYTVDQCVPGTVTNLVDFGAFVALEIGVEGLVHISELADPEPEKPSEILQSGDEVIVRILSIDPFRRRIALSLKSVPPQEGDDTVTQQHQDGQ